MKALQTKALLWSAFMVLIFSTDLVAQIEFSGDARMRPRWDVNDRTDVGNSLSRDLYTMYRARLRMKADIGDGWAFQTMLGHNGVGEYAGKFAKGELPDILGVEQTDISNDAARRATVDFMELYIRYSDEQHEVKVGLFPVGSVGNPVYDLHYYPIRMIDIPYFIFNNDGAYGASYLRNWGPTKLNATLYVDDDRGGYLRSATGTTLKDENDMYTLELGLNHQIGAINWNLQTLYTLAADSISQPFSVSLQSKGWKAGSVDLQYQFMFSKQNKNQFGNDGHFGLPLNAYEAYFLRITAAKKFNDDRFRVWFDLSQRTDQLDTESAHHLFTYMWLDYTIQLAKTENGTVVLTPRWRSVLHQEEEVTVQARQKFEIDLDIFF